MVLDATTFKPWTKMELVRRFPNLLSGAEGEGEGAGTGSPNPSGDESGTTTTPPKDEGTGTTTEPEVFDKAYVEALRSENAARRIKEKEANDELAKYKAAEAERQKAEMSEAERARAEKAEADARAEKAERELIDERKRNAIISEASKLKFRDPEDALAYVDLGSISMTEAGTPHKTSIEAAVKKIAEEKKYLVEGPGSADGGSPGSTPKTNAQREAEIQADINSRGGVQVSV